MDSGFKQGFWTGAGFTTGLLVVMGLASLLAGLAGRKRDRECFAARVPWP